MRTIRPAASFPSRCRSVSASLPLEYRFEPGNEDDGITVTVPRAALEAADLRPAGLAGAGLAGRQDRGADPFAAQGDPPQLCARSGRRQARRWANCSSARVRSWQPSPRRWCGWAASRWRPAIFNWTSCPSTCTSTSASWTTAAKCSPAAATWTSCSGTWGRTDETAVPAEFYHPDWHRDGIGTWDFGDLPEQVSILSGGVTLTAFPMLVDRGAEVWLRLADSPQAAVWQTRGGLRRLCCLAERHELRAQVGVAPAHGPDPAAGVGVVQRPGTGAAVGRADRRPQLPGRGPAAAQRGRVPTILGPRPRADRLGRARRVVPCPAPAGSASAGPIGAGAGPVAELAVRGGRHAGATGGAYGRRGTDCQSVLQRPPSPPAAASSSPRPGVGCSSIRGTSAP